MEPELRLAQALGAHAVAAFLGALALLLLLVTAVWFSVRGVERGIGHAPLPSVRALLPRLLLAFVAVAGAGYVFVEMAEALGAGAAVVRFDTALAAALRLQLTPAVLQAFSFVTRLGDTVTLTLLCIAVAAVLLWRRQRTLALAWVVAVAGNGLLTRLLKRSFERTRPLHDHGFVVAEGWSFPSGHSSGSVVAYGMLAYVALRFVPSRWQLPVLLLAAATAFTTGVSRILLQAHYASDVLAGFASGTVWLTLCVLAIEWARQRQRR